jgi:hypothetical protein
MIFKHYRAVVDEEAAKSWFSIMPPEGWPPQEWKFPIQRWK